MTSGIEVRDGGLPRRSGARRRGHGGQKVTIAPDGSDALAPAKPRPDETLIRALARAHRWKRMLDLGSYHSAVELAEAEDVTRSFVNRLLRLTLLAPGIVEAILDGRQPKVMPLEELTKAIPSEWEKQRKALLSDAARAHAFPLSCVSPVRRVNRKTPRRTDGRVRSDWEVL